MNNLKQLLKNRFSIQLLPTSDDIKKEMSEAFIKLNKLRTINKTKAANKFNESLIKELRNKIKETEMNVCVLKHKGKNAESYVMIQDYVSYKMPLKERKDLFLLAYDEYKKHKKNVRQEEVAVAPLNKTEMGFKYQLTGGVFNKPGGVLALQSIESQRDRIQIAKAPSKGNKRNYVGVELEFICRIDKATLEKKFCEAYLGGYVYVKRDGSINPENTGDHAHEVTILCPENSFESIVTRVCNLLNTKAIGGYVNNSCGLHVHYDARNRDVNTMFTNMVCVLPLAIQMVPKNRLISSHAHQYCKLNKHKLFDEQKKIGDRYTAINAESFRTHNTIEVRLHSGTLNATKINAWIKTFLNAINYGSLLDDDISTVSKYFLTFGVDAKLAEYMSTRIKLFNERGDAIDTRADHHLFNDVVAI